MVGSGSEPESRKPFYPDTDPCFEKVISGSGSILAGWSNNNWKIIFISIILNSGLQEKLNSELYEKQKVGSSYYCGFPPPLLTTLLKPSKKYPALGMPIYTSQLHQYFNIRIILKGKTTKKILKKLGIAIFLCQNRKKALSLHDLYTWTHEMVILYAQEALTHSI